MNIENTSELADLIAKGQPARLTLSYYTRGSNKYVSSLVKKVLERENYHFLRDTVMTIVRELIMNAVKANSKRWYFLEKNLDIAGEKDYTEGMAGFKSYFTSAGEGIAANLKSMNLTVELSIAKNPAGLDLVIENNTPILPLEMERVQGKLAQARKYDDFSDAYAELGDSVEGEGLGLILTMLFLRNSGIGENSLSITTDGKTTRTSIAIPRNLKPAGVSGEIKERIIAEVDGLPTFPENIRELTGLLADKNVSIKALADKISADPALSASVLKLAHSAEFVTRKSADTIADAVNIVGLKNVNAIVVAAGARSAMDKKFSSYKKIWEHSNRVAFYARTIASMRSQGALADRVFLAGLLHDLGMIILLATAKSLGEWIAGITKQHEIRTSTAIEEVAIGISHSEIGELIAKKWNLPDYLCAAIRSHHSPTLSPEEFRTITMIVYTANELCNIESGMTDYWHMESEALGLIGVADAKEFAAFHESVKNAYGGQQIV